MDDCKFRMVELMHLYLSGVITDEETRELQEWLDAAPENKRMFDKVRAGKDIVYRYKRRWIIKPRTGVSRNG